MTPASLELGCIRVPGLNMRACIDAALQRELEDLIAEDSCGENREIEYLDEQPFLPALVEPIAAACLGFAPSPGPLPSGKHIADMARRRDKRKKARELQPGRPRYYLCRKYPKPYSFPIKFNSACLPAAKGAWVGQQQTCKKKEWTLEGLIQENYEVVPWDGCTPFAIVDAEGRVMTMLAGRPNGAKDWDGVHARMSELLEKAAKKVKVPCGDRRGQFTPLTTGVSHGNGRTAPGNFKHDPPEQAVIDELTGDKSFRRAAGFMNSCFGFYAPKLYDEYCQKMTQLYSKYPDLKQVFKSSVFPAATFNCGTRVVTLEHVDNTNLAFGLCAIYACGSYNPIKGGHLILFDLQLVVQFPPGSTILVPSSTIRHGNVAIQADETRQSFTQFCPGGLFRWVDYGFMSVKSSPAELKRSFQETHHERHQYAVGLLSKIDELEGDRQKVFNFKCSD